jgi:F-type H+-transporting ATPase subunit b
MGIITPNPGLVFWTTFTFVILLLILRKYAWPSILRALKVREETIAFAIQDARKAKEEAEQMEKVRKQVLAAARAERENILKEAGELKKQILAETREAAREETERMLQQARLQINKEQQDALNKIRETIGLLSVDIAEKILKSELSDTGKHEKMINTYLDDVSFN